MENRKRALGSFSPFEARRVLRATDKLAMLTFGDDI